MKTNRGGYIAPEHVIGRDDLIQEIWETLEQQSVVLTAARRMGKTSIIKKIQHEAAGHILAIYRDLEGIRSPFEFVETVYADVETYLQSRTRLTKKAGDFMRQIAGAEVKGVKLPQALNAHWKTLLMKTVEDLEEQGDHTVIFLWDELPMMLENIRQDHGEATAMEVLDALRAVRQTYPTIRMVYTGSIGLHHVIGSLRARGYTNAPKNDMATIDVPPLSPDDAQHLAELLLTGEQIAVVDLSSLAASIAHSVDGVPFYIHHVIAGLRRVQTPLTTESAEQIVIECLTDAQDRWDMSHYRTRLDTYYRPDERTLALHLLDVLAVEEQALPDRELFNLLASRIALTDREPARDVLTLLMRDHYIIQHPVGAYRFYLPLLRRWWRSNRGLES